MTQRLTPRQLRKALDAAEVAEFKSPTAIATLRDKMDVGTFTATGWEPPSHLSEAGWLRVGEALQEAEAALPWFWGDWWAARGLRTLPDDWAGPARHTLDNREVVAKAFPSSRRREKLSIAHHGELTALPEAEQDSLLDWSITTGASVRALRAERQRRAAPPEVVPPLPGPSAAPSRITSPSTCTPSPAAVEPLAGDVAIPITLYVPADLHAWARQVASDADIPLGAWIISLIKQAKDGVE